jgi:cytochrome c peroxidase
MALSARLTLAVKLAVALAAASLCAQAQLPLPQPSLPGLPPGFALPPIPADNPQSPAKVELGRRLFAEGRLAVDGHTSCAVCHQPGRAYTDGRATPRGATGARLPRNAPTLYNVAYLPLLGWASTASTSLEAQMRTPLLGTHPVEMGLAGREVGVLKILEADSGYKSAFEAAFADDAKPVSIANLIKAIAAFERTLISGRSGFDRYVFDDDRRYMSAAARRGMALFYGPRTGCGECHSGLQFSTGQLAPSGIRGADAGLALETGKVADKGRFRVPTLRNVALTAPYMHDGSLPTLAAVVSFYNRGGHPPRKPLALTRGEQQELLAFLESLTEVSPP